MRHRWAGALALAASLAVLIVGCTSGASPSRSANVVPPIAAASPTAGSGGPATPDQLQNEFIAVVRRVSPSVVVIETDQGLGSGVIFDASGDVVTNAHVAAGATTFRVTLADGHSSSATLVGAFAQDDLAVVKMESAGDLHPATFADSSALQVGEIVMAIGNPLGLQSSVTDGIISALNRTVSEPGGAVLPGVIQTSAPINPGNSGGALVNLNGEVVGIPTLTATDPQIGGSAPGIGFAIPSNLANDIATQLVQHGHVVNSHRAYLGIQTADTMGGQGVYVARVQAGSPAAAAGLAAGELITKIDDTATPDSQTLLQVLANDAPGDRVRLSLLKPDGSTATVTVTLGQLPG